ncbi:MAG: hypothetical protein HYY25_14600 [Candidatus Wallbacteria bacterium]|nr:hypothetical protein [Candidatus Wallbacteria bacterium]
MTRWMQPVRMAWNNMFAAVPGMILAMVRWLYFWGLVARSFLVRQGALKRQRPTMGRAPMPTSPALAARSKAVPAAVAGRA